MKKILVFLALVLCVSISSAQYRNDLVSLTTASAQWDSVYTGGAHSKYIDVTNYGADSLFVCTENDTLITQKLYIPPWNTYRWVDSPARWVRTKASTGTIKRQVIITVGNPRKGQ